jgi:hypothetical protein
VTIRSFRLRRSLILCAVVIPSTGSAALAQSTSDAGRTRVGHTAPEVPGQRDFDFEIGSWKAQIKRLVNPLTGSTTWAEYEGTSVVRKVWDGRANLGELQVAGPAGRIEGLSLRLFNPTTRQWHISWANSRDGALGPAMVGGFANGGGEFYNQETLNGRSIYVRFIFSDITPNSFGIDQAFSADGGKTWEVNWIARFTR